MTTAARKRGRRPSVPPGPKSPAAPVALAPKDADFLGGLGRRVRRAREERALARKAVCSAAGVSERYLAALEAGEGNASVILLRRVAAALGVRITDLVSGDETGPEERQLQRLLDSLAPERRAEALRRLTLEFGHDASVRHRRITLIGLRGAGKSTLGEALARQLRRPFIELDHEIEKEAGMALTELFLLNGPSAYRRLERRCLEKVLRAPEDFVMSVGGGLVSEAETYQLLLAHCYTVWVKAAPEEHMARVVAQGDLRPMAGNDEAMGDLQRILAAREPLYARADATLDTTGRSIAACCTALARLVSAVASRETART